MGWPQKWVILQGSLVSQIAEIGLVVWNEVENFRLFLEMQENFFPQIKMLSNYSINSISSLFSMENFDSCKGQHNHKCCFEIGKI